MMDFMEEAKARGFVAQCTDESALTDLINQKKIGGYIGFDATADSLHVGSLVQIMLLRLFEKHGHKAHILIGGATTMIGDPSFRDTARTMLDDNIIHLNRLGLLNVFHQFFDERVLALRTYNNLNWFKNITYLDLLREIGPHFSVNRMLSFESVKSRLDREQGLSFLEFNYAILQSYDFRHLVRQTEEFAHPIMLQMGGSDQWGNIVSGIDLIRKTDQKTVYGLTAPLVTTSTGEKMGKTAAGAVWLSANKLSPYEYWQFWRNVSDADVGRFLRLFTDMSLDAIEDLEKLKGSDINVAKQVLANQATEIAHGLKQAQLARQTAHNAFYGDGSTENLPKIAVDAAELAAGIPITRLFTLSGLTESNGAARRLIEGGGAKIDDQPVDDPQTVISREVKLSAGKKRHVLIRNSEK